MSFDSDLPDDILPQPTNAPERAIGKFMPKARRKNEKVVQQAISFDHPVRDGVEVSPVHAPQELLSAEGCMHTTSSPLHDSNSNDCSRRYQGSSVGQSEIGLPGSDSLDGISTQLTTSTDRVVGELQPEVRPGASTFISPYSSPSRTCESPSSGFDPALCAPKPFETQECIRISHSEDLVSDGDIELQTDSGRSKEKEARVLASLEPLKGSSFHTSEASECPMLGAASSGAGGDLQTDPGPGGETESSPFDRESVDKDLFSSGMTNYSEAMIPDHTIDLEVAHGRFPGEGESVLSEDILLQPTLNAARVVSKFQPKLGPKVKKAKTVASASHDTMEPAGSSKTHSSETESLKRPELAFPLDSSTSTEHPTNKTMRDNAKASADNHRELDTSHDMMERDRINSQERKILRQEEVGEAAEDHSQGTPDGGGTPTEDVEVNNASRPFRQLRKRKSVCHVLNEVDDGHEENWEPGADLLNDSEIVEESSDDEYTGQKSSRKGTRRKPRSFQDGKEKPPLKKESKPRKHKKGSFGSDSSTQEPQKKRFPHSTRRSKRQVDKVLLETPEEDIDPMRLKIKDLIILAEAKERIAVKEAASVKQSVREQSDSPFGNNSSFANGDQEEDLNVDGDETNHTDHFGSTKLNYHTYMSRTRSDRWSKVDTELFYQGVRQFGSDFAMIQQLFPNRTRHQIKLKFKNEERKYPLQIADALVHRPKDHSQFELVIQRLEAQEEETSNADAADDAVDESQTKTTGNEEESPVKADKKEEEEGDDWDQGHDSVNPYEYEDVFDWSKVEYNSLE